MLFIGSKRTWTGSRWQAAGTSREVFCKSEKNAGISSIQHGRQLTRMSWPVSRGIMQTNGSQPIATCLALTKAISKSRTVEEIYEAALDALSSGLGVGRSAILLCCRLAGSSTPRFCSSTPTA